MIRMLSESLVQLTLQDLTTSVKLYYFKERKNLIFCHIVRFFQHLVSKHLQNAFLYRYWVTDVRLSEENT